MNAVTFSELFQRIGLFFKDFQWVVIPEAILIFLLMFFVIKVLHANGAKKLIILYFSVLAVMGIATLFSADENAALFFFLVLLLMSMFFLLLFSVEIKRSIWRANKKSTNSTASQKSTHAARTTVHTEECVSNIVKAVQNLSKSDTGALIVLSNGNLPKEILESGVLLDSSVSSQLIEGIFVPKAPLHDGAMIILGDRIQAAGCFLPLTQKDYPKEFGTRHRAGIGVTEAADVMAVIVSEETGIVSVVKRGEITRYVDSDGLRKFLREYYWKEITSEGRKD